MFLLSLGPKTPFQGEGCLKATRGSEGKALATAPAVASSVQELLPHD